MKARDALRNLLQQGSFRDVLDRYRERYGRGASRQLASRYGVTQRTAQRALRGDTRSPKFTRSEKFQADRAADAVRHIHTAHAGEVSLVYDGDRDEGQRDIGDRDFDEGDLDEVAERLEAEDWDAAGDAMDAAILNQYGGLGDSNLTISDYETGLSFD